MSPSSYMCIFRHHAISPYDAMGVYNKHYTGSGHTKIKNKFYEAKFKKD